MAGPKAKRAFSRARLKRVLAVIGPTLLVPSESIDEHCAAHLWRLRPEVRDDAVVTRPSCLHRHGIRPPGAREYPRSFPPARSRGIGEFHTTQPNSRPVCVHRRLTRLTPRVRPAGLLRELVHVGEDRGRSRQARTGAFTPGPRYRSTAPTRTRHPLANSIAQNPTTLTIPLPRPNSRRSSPARTRRRRGASGRPPTTSGTSARRNSRAEPGDRRAGHRPSNRRPSRASCGRRGPSPRWDGGDRGRGTTRRTRRCSIAGTRTRGRCGRRR